MLLNLIVELEKEFAIEIGINEVDIKNFDTIKKISKYVYEKLDE